MQKHPNDITRRIIHRYFAGRDIAVQVHTVRCGYGTFFDYFSAVEACNVDEGSRRLVYDDGRNDWKLYKGGTWRRRRQPAKDKFFSMIRMPSSLGGR